MSNSLLVQLYFKGCPSPICLLLPPLQSSRRRLVGLKAVFSGKERVEYVYSTHSRSCLSAFKDCITLGPDF